MCGKGPKGQKGLKGLVSLIGLIWLISPIGLISPISLIPLFNFDQAEFGNFQFSIEVGITSPPIGGLLSRALAAGQLHNNSESTRPTREVVHFILYPLPRLSKLKGVVDIKQNLHSFEWRLSDLLYSVWDSNP